MIILSFLGLGKRDREGNDLGYEITTYQWKDKSEETDIFGKVLLKWFPDAPLYVVVTQEVKESNNYRKFKDAAGSRLETIEIPLGKNETEMWDIFDSISQQIPKGDVIFDFTHGFRSSPMIALLALAYLQSLGRNNIKHLLYGAYEAKDINNVTPVFDLKPMFQLLEWANAANFFLETGNAKLLSKLSQTTSARSQLHNTMEQIVQLSESLLLVRPDHIYNDTKKLLDSLDKQPKSELPQYKPFKFLSDQIHDTFKPLDKDDELERELALLNWYIKREHWMHAVTLAREWMVSLAVQLQDYSLEDVEEVTLHESKEKEKSSREVAEIWLYKAKKQPKNTLPQKLGKYFGKLANFRNDLAHFGKRPDPRDVEKIRQRAIELPELLQGFYEEYIQYRENKKSDA